MLRRRVTAAYDDCKSTSRANLVHKVREVFPDAVFEDQEYFYLYQPYVTRAVGQTVRYWFEEIENIGELVETIDDFFKEVLLEGSDLIRLQEDFNVSYGSSHLISNNGYVILSLHTGQSKQSELKQLSETVGFDDEDRIYGLEPREYGYLRYPDVSKPTGIVLKYWYENMDEKTVHEALSKVESAIHHYANDGGKTVFTIDVRKH